MQSELLIMEHRLIELILKRIHVELDRLAKTGKSDPLFVEDAVDFINAYANRSHREKEEGLLIDEPDPERFFNAERTMADKWVHKEKRVSVAEVFDE